MPTYKLAHIREQSQNMLLFPLESSFGHQSDAAQEIALMELQSRAHGAGLAGLAVAVWERGGRMNFRGPRSWHRFLRSISMAFVLRNVNRSISW